MAKDPKSVEEQIELLKSRNLAFRDESTAPHFLKNISYYRLKGYWWEMQDDFVNHHFRDGSFFEDAIDTYNFDRHFRLIVFNAIERIEIALRTKLIYHLSLTREAFWYLNPALFDSQTNYAGFLSGLFSDMGRSSEEFMLKHYENHPEEHPESWKALEVLTLGKLSKLYKNLNHQMPEKSRIANEFGLYNQKHLSSWLLTITVIRNIIAHHGRLWNRVIINKYDWPTNSPLPILDYHPNNHQRRKIFPILSAIIYLNDRVSPGHHLKPELFKLFEDFDNIPLIKMGFPSNWRDQPIWQS